MTDDQHVLITGGTGSWGRELTRQLLKDDGIERIVIYSRGEHAQVAMRREFSDFRVQFMIGDVRDLSRLNVAMKGVGRVYHLAALKHVPVCEQNPWEAIQTNITGTNNVIEAAIANEVPRVVYVSTDKAVDPFNVYGLTKSCAERLIVNANLLGKGTKFVCMRAGNVLGSTGSVVPLFISQIASQNSVTLTDRRMTRFFMRMEEAIERVLSFETLAVGGEIIVLRMPACRIIDLAEVLIESHGGSETEIRETGRRPGEKLHELLVSEHETDRLILEKDRFVILPTPTTPELDSRYGPVTKTPPPGYSSESAERMEKEAVRDLLRRAGFVK